MTEQQTTTKTAFQPIDASEEAINSGLGITEVESLCMNCHENGLTKLMLTRIPFYRDVIISSFQCDHCHYKNNGIESANRIQENGVRISLTVEKETDLNRELVKSDYATLSIPEIEFEIPPNPHQKGCLTTVEGVIDRVISNIQSDIELRKNVDKELAGKLEIFLAKVQDLKKFKLGKFHVVINDPSGDSFVENPKAPSKDPQLTISYYKRNDQQNELIGLTSETDQTIADSIAAKDNDLRNEVVQFHNNCPNCNAICETNMKLTDIPYFKTVIIMATICESCGVRSSEVKPGTGIEEKGVKFTLKLTDPSDLNRDLLKSDTASFEIPELDFYMNAGTLGGKFTTIEGILKDCRENLSQVAPFLCGGDSDKRETHFKLKEILDKLALVQDGQMLNVSVILDDPSGNSYMQVRVHSIPFNLF